MKEDLPYCSRVGSWYHLPVIFLTLSFLSMAVSSPTIAQPQPTSTSIRTLTVTGKGEESIPTTISKINLGVEVQGKASQTVQQELARRSAAVVQLLRTRNVEKLETTSIQLNPVYSYENNRQRLTGYIGTNTVSFRVATPRAGEIIDAAVTAGATRVDNISFIATDEAIATAQQQALREATQDAQQQANTVLNALNLYRTGIVSIQINGAATPPPTPVPIAELRVAKADASTPVIGAEQQVEASVTLQISYTSR